MFYSQFILAKKGPLGTIWIAAHLERKLRKNQVADTDIGVSVDSILFPDVPIALRLSSHLLLGVVRIYSRKVNYLFHDCSETLLKVKQAFRSTAVDLPPEESTAPYHSITLPETFDLDDFELPDNEFFQGNYVDHHVSTREQITLQDTMDGVVYSTSQFGLDERFGDGDTSQIGLDLDEDLFLDKVSASRHTAVLVEMDDVDPQASGQAMTPYPDMDIDDDEQKYGEDRIAEASERMRVDINGEPVNSDPQDQMVVDVPSLDLIAGLQVPSPGLVDNDVPANGCVQQDLATAVACNLQLDSEYRDSENLVEKYNLGIPSHMSNLQNDDRNIELESSVINNEGSNTDVPMSNGENGSMSGNEQLVQVKQHDDSSSTVVASDPVSVDLAGSMASPTSVLAEQAKPIFPAAEILDGTLAATDRIERPGASVSTMEETSGKPNRSVGSFDENSNLISDCQPVSEGMPEIDSVSHETFEPEKIEGNTCAELEDPYIPSGVGSDEKVSSHNHMLHACNSVQPDVLSSLGEENLVESAPDSSPRGAEPGLSETVGEKETSAAGHGEEGDKVMGSVPSDNVQTDLTKSNEQLDATNSKDINEETTECPASSDLPAPEILLSAPEAVLDVASDLLAESSPGKEVSTGLGENDGGIGTLSKRKRHLMERTPDLPEGNTANLSGITRSKRNLDSVPDDDDLLSSILVGRKSSILKLKPTPPQPEIPASKRRRVAARVSVPKRKVLMDDSMVLHGDTIRQQLTTTEDIRRLRKKAPCTRPEIWMIEKHLLEEDFFGEPLFSGMPVELIDLQNGIFDISEVKVFEVDENKTPQKGANLDEPVVVGGDNEGHEPTTALLKRENQLPGEHLQNSVPTNDGQLGEGSSVEVDKAGTIVADTEESHAPILESDLPEFSGSINENDFTASSVSRIKLLSTDKELISESDEKLGKSIEEEALDNEKGVDAINAVGLNGEGLISTEDEPIEKGGTSILESENGGLAKETVPNILQEDALENGTCVLTDASVPSVHVNPSSEIDDHGKDGTRRSELEVANEDEIVTEKVREDDGNSDFNLISSEEPQRYSVCEVNGDEENAPHDIGENVGFQEADAGMSMNEESNAMDTATGDPVDIENKMGGIDTEFLNFNDDEVDEEEEDNDMPNSEEPRVQENSGWSSRTRAVAKYLQIMFDKESGSGEVRKSIPVDKLLSGKSRKEASRMFFETLVLKTRDYIHVEQEKPFENINIKPKVKLMKSDFGSISH